VFSKAVFSGFPLAISASWAETNRKMLCVSYHLIFWFFTKMPRTSSRQKHLIYLRSKVKHNNQRAILRFLLDMEDDYEDIIDAMDYVRYQDAKAKRYMFRSSKYRKKEVIPSAVAHKMLYSDRLNDGEFLEHFRMSRQMFMELHDRLYGNEDDWSRGKGSSELHLLTFLKYFGANGNEATASKMGKMFGISKGCFRNYVDRVTEKILLHKETTLFWPGEEERKEISGQIQNKFLFQNCVGFIDGTLVPFERKPSIHGEDYYCRKGFYALNIQVVFDDALRIRDVVIG
jgi:hypothetical protein